MGNISEYVVYLEYFKYITPILLFVGIFVANIPLVKGQVVERFYNKAIKRSELDQVYKEKKGRLSDYYDNSVTRWMDDTFKYARIRDKLEKFHIRTSVQFFMATSALCLAVGLVAVVLFNDLAAGLLGLIIVFAILYGYLFYRRAANNKAVGNEIVLFLNLLGNYSTANTEIMSVFMQIAPKMQSFLSDVLIECVAESQKDPTLALENLMSKVENKKFREILKSITVSQKYSGSFRDAVIDNRNSINSYIQSQKQLRSMVLENSITMIVCSIVLVAIVFILGQIIEENLFIILITTTLGRLVLAVFLIGILYFAKKMLEVSV